MANYATLKNAIQQVIKQNGNNEITGAIMQSSLLSMIDALGGNYQYAGIATPTTNPGTPDQNVFYLASTSGTYVNFSNIVIGAGEISVLRGSGSTWYKDSVGAVTAEQIDLLIKQDNAISHYLSELALTGTGKLSFYVPGLREVGEIDTISANAKYATTPITFHTRVGDKIKVSNIASGHKVILFSSSNQQFGWLTADYEYISPLEQDWTINETTADNSDINLGDITTVISVVDNTSRINENIKDVKQNTLDISASFLGAHYAEQNGSFDISTGELSPAVGKSTRFVPFSNKIFNTLIARTALNNFYYKIAFFDADKNLIPSISVPGESSLSIVTTTIDVSGSQYDNAAYVLASTYVNAGAGFPESILRLELYNNKYIEDVSNLFNIGSPITGKTINALGDSITSVDYVTPNWWQKIAARVGASFNNYGVSGSRICKRSGVTDSFCERVTTMDTSADGVIVMGGTNDDATEIGEWDSTSQYQFYGALNYLIPYLLNNYQGKPILFCTPIQPKLFYPDNILDPLGELKNMNPLSGPTIQLRAEAIKAKCRQYGVPCLDLYNGSGISGVNNVYYIDNLHPSATGQERLSILIQNALENLF